MCRNGGSVDVHDGSKVGAMHRGEPEDCWICGRLVLPVAGWAVEIPADRHLVVDWRTGPAEFSGRLHHTCLRSWEHRAAYRRGLETLLRRGDITVAFVADGQRRLVRQHGLHYAEEIFAGQHCRVLQSDRSDAWVVLEHDGPAHHVSYAALQRIGAGLPVRGGGQVERTRLNAVPAGAAVSGSRSGLLESWSGLLDQLGIADCYPDSSASYRYVDFDPSSTVLEYTVDTALPLPSEAVAFLRDHADEYRPVDAREWDDDDAWDDSGWQGSGWDVAG